MLRLTEDFKKASVQQGDKFELFLKDSLNSSYKWQFIIAKGDAKIIKQEFTPEKEEGTVALPIPSKGKKRPPQTKQRSKQQACCGYLSVIFEAVSKGDIEIQAVYQSETGKHLNRTKIFRIKVN